MNNPFLQIIPPVPTIGPTLLNPVLNPTLAGMPTLAPARVAVAVAFIQGHAEGSCLARAIRTELGAGLGAHPARVVGRQAYPRGAIARRAAGFTYPFD